MTSRTVAIVVHEGVQALDVTGPLDVFAEANAFVAEPDRYQTRLIGPSTQPLHTSNGMMIVADQSFDEVREDISLLLVAGGPALPDAVPDDMLSTWLRRHSAHAELYGAICTGAFALGHAGLLDGKAATTHWQNAAKLAVMFPAANVEPDRLYVQDGALVTSAGVTAGIDLALALVGRHHGASIARSVAKRLVVVAQRQGGQSQFSPFLAAPADDTSPLSKVQAYVLEHIGEAFPMERLAEIGGVGARSLARLFAKEAEMTPHAFIEAARIDVARNLLEGGTLPLKAIAYDCGFGTAEHMRIVFERRIGISPAQYRANFQTGG